MKTLRAISAALVALAAFAGAAGAAMVTQSVVFEASDGALIHAVLADVWPDSTAHAVGVGRLRTSFPSVNVERSLVDANGEIVEPYGDYAAKSPATPGATREYHVEFWPIGNRFEAGHRVRLYLVGASGYMLPAPGVNLVALGGATP